MESAAARGQALVRGVTAKATYFRLFQGRGQLLAVPELAIYTIAHDVAVQGNIKHVVPDMLTGGVYDSVMAVATEAKTNVARVESAATRIQALSRRIDVAPEAVAETPEDPQLHRLTFKGHALATPLARACIERSLPVRRWAWPPL